ncbi:hypothetical protein TRFO_25449 [Tritrichomonas foetus]|uniref:Uncharacterized protein n=1 Tax=Tritrichomonas foetus TaxID=1144522 RepID=A0A1J4K5Q8_9EUKA|nr:hypothetical protein TRFO_25449 [Tritrichomonas foetus]|eukprot:OHT06499.1 hypothetical protein TRFO_25449 [Tritrichomonas foetus]
MTQEDANVWWCKLACFDREDASKMGVPSRNSMVNIFKDISPILYNRLYDHVDKDDFWDVCIDTLKKVTFLNQFPNPNINFNLFVLFLYNSKEILNPTNLSMCIKYVTTFCPPIPNDFFYTDFIKSISSPTLIIQCFYEMNKIQLPQWTEFLSQYGVAERFFDLFLMSLSKQPIKDEIKLDAIFCLSDVMTDILSKYREMVHFNLIGSNLFDNLIDLAKKTSDQNCLRFFRNLFTIINLIEFNHKRKLDLFRLFFEIFKKRALNSQILLAPFLEWCLNQIELRKLSPKLIASTMISNKPVDLISFHYLERLVLRNTNETAGIIVPYLSKLLFQSVIFMRTVSSILNKVLQNGNLPENVKNFFKKFLMHSFVTVSIFSELKKYQNRMLCFVTWIFSDYFMKIEWLSPFILKYAFYASYKKISLTNRVLKSFSSFSNSTLPNSYKVKSAEKDVDDAFKPNEKERKNKNYILFDLNESDDDWNEVNCIHQSYKEYRTFETYKNRSTYKCLPFGKNSNSLADSRIEIDQYSQNDSRILDMGVPSNIAWAFTIDETISKNDQLIITYSIEDYIDEEQQHVNEFNKVMQLQQFCNTSSYLYKDRQLIQSYNSIMKRITDKMFEMQIKKSNDFITTFVTVKELLIKNPCLNVDANLLFRKLRKIMSTDKLYDNLKSKRIGIINKISEKCAKADANIQLEPRFPTAFYAIVNLYNYELEYMPQSTSFDDYFHNFIILTNIKHDIDAIYQLLKQNRIEAVQSAIIEISKLLSIQFKLGISPAPRPKSFSHKSIPKLNHFHSNTNTAKNEHSHFSSSSSNQNASVIDKYVFNVSYVNLLTTCIYREVFSTIFNSESVLNCYYEENALCRKKALSHARNKLKIINFTDGLFSDTVMNYSIIKVFKRNTIQLLWKLEYEFNPIDIASDIYMSLSSVTNMFKTKKVSESDQSLIVYCLILCSPPANSYSISLMLEQWMTILSKPLQTVSRFFIDSILKIMNDP